MRFAGITLLALLLALLSSTVAPAADDAPFFFVQIADTQLGFNGNKSMELEIAHFKDAVPNINRLKPAFVLFSGDMVDKAHSPKQIRAFWSLAHEIDPCIPLHFVAGNHDLAAGTAADLNSYRKLFGDDHYSFSCGGSEFIVIDSGLFGKGADQTLRDEQRKWFESQLIAARAKSASHIFVCDHHPWFLKTTDEPAKYQNVAPPYREDYLALMKQYKVEYALAGHLHYDLIAKDGDLTIVAAGPLSKSLAKSVPVVGFRIWKVYKDRVETQFYPLDKIPATVRL